MSWHSLSCQMYLAAIVVVSAGNVTLEQCGSIPLPGVEGRLDQLTVDVKSQRLFLAASGNNSIEIVGVREGRRLQSIAGLNRPCGIAYVPRVNWICVANSEDGTLRFHDAGNYQPKQIIRGFEDADNIRYDRQTDRLYVGFGKGAIGIIDASQGLVLGMIKLPGHPESFQIDHDQQILFVNVPQAKQVARIDMKTRAVSGAWTIGKFRGNFPLGLDSAHRRLFVGYRRPARLVVLDSHSGRSVANLPISEDADDLFFDAKRKRIYLSCGEGFIDVIEQAGPNQYRSLEKVPTATGARTSFFSPDLDLLAVAVPRRGTRVAEIRLYQPR